MKEQLPKQVYTHEYREQAVLLVTRDGLTLPKLRAASAMYLKTLANWVKRAKDGRLPASAAGAVAGRRMVTDAEAENSRLPRENAEFRMECDIMKKATA